MALPAPDAVATVTATRAYPTLRAAWIPMLALCMAFFVEMVDNTLLSIALPTIGRDLGAGTTDLQWVTGAYSLTFGGLLLTAGSVADRFGRRRVLQVGLTLFGLISLLVVWVDTPAHLIALRAALGVPAAMMAPITNSLVFRLFDSAVVRRQAITVMIVVGMSGFVLGPLLGGTALAHVRWEWLLAVNAPIALLALLGVRLGVGVDDPAGLTHDRLDLPGALLSVVAIGLACYTATAGVDHGWTSPVTIGSAVGAVAAVVGFIARERTAPTPMLDLVAFRDGAVRGAAIAQVGTAIAMAGVMFSLILHYQYAFGWSPLKAGLANLPFIITMVAANPISEALGRRLGNRVACLVGAVLLAGALGGLAWAVEHGYLAISVFVVVFTVGMRTVMTTCAVALVDAMPENRTSMATALNDTAQEVGSSLGTAVVGTLIATLVTAALPAGAWNPALVERFFGGERIAFTVLAVAVGALVAWGVASLPGRHAAIER
ncbi:MFS transporter [Xylanimonas ulmi]|uniref:EmrB/QacA subfamily drug resistance transporter n=1 Tax=Xylanimonas ulmi TaxID=228973 RepID=A0A4Q7LY73_9MICO|nr:MFS transporter [Xylanibacterium ulmi]RZS60115.1 EmrB/QacA subfamily drug resistance transporter [Xylanibacterium ulmi]